MGRSRSPRRDRRRSRSRSRSGDRHRGSRRPRSRSRNRSRDRDYDRSRRRDSRDRYDSRGGRGRDTRDRSRSRDRRRHRSRSGSGDRRYRRSRSPDRPARQERGSSQAGLATPSPVPGAPPVNLQPPQPAAPVPAPSAPTSSQPSSTAPISAEEEKRRRLEAFKAKLAAKGSAPSEPAAPPTAIFTQDDEEEEPVHQGLPTAAELIAARKARADAEEAADMEKKRARLESQAASMAAGDGYPVQAPGQAAGEAGEGLQDDDDEVDPLDAFMAGEVLPEVLARQEAERKEREAARLKQAELLAAGQGPAKPAVLSDSDEEPEPDAKIQIPRNKVKYVVGPGGTNIQHIQRKSKARIQVQKDEDELNRAWGTGGVAGSIKAQAEEALARAALQQQHKEHMAALKAKKQQERQKQSQGGDAEGGAGGGGAQEGGDGQGGEESSSSSDEESTAPNAPARRMTTLLLYGDAKALEIATRMINEAIDNREQKKKQREKEYAKKREEKSRNRQLYILRHTRDYEILEVPPGTSKEECKKAYRKLVLLWHPDKHPNNQEEAKAKFQAIQKAFDRLMSTDEEERIEALAN